MAAYPRKQTVITFLICTGAVLGVAYYLDHGSLFVQTSKGVTTTIPITIKPAVTQTLQDNGNWKKQFAAAGDTSSSFKPVKASDAKESSEKLTVTDQMGRYFFTNYAQLSQAGLTEDEKSVDVLMNKAASQGAAAIAQPKSFFSKDINVVSDSPATVGAYHSIVELTAKDYIDREDDVAIAVSAFENEDLAQLSKIDSTIKSYNDMIARLISAPVPRTFSQSHLDLLNGLSILLYSAKAFRHMDTDPVMGLAAVKTESIGLQNTETAFSDINSYFTLGKI